MSPVNVSSSLSLTPQCASNDLTGQAANVAPQENNNATLESSQNHEAGQLDRGKLLELAALREKDPTHILLRRFVYGGGLCLDLEANFLERDVMILRQMIESGDHGLEEYHEKYMTRLGRYYQFGCQFSKILEFDEPSGALLNNVLCLAREKWGEGQGGHLNAEKEDWAPLYEMDKLDQLILLVFHHSFTRRLMRAFSPRHEKEEMQLTFIPGGFARFALVGLFNCFVSVLVSAPVAIMTLNLMSPGGMIATYLAFVLVAGFFIQSLVKGFTRQLLVYLAYASVMAAVLRLKE
ncbi:hypothetical protein BKA59DRAFT_474245 [Fusarium tricinctum]|uniref:Uncharacterized protein n=1 Tax=Fusarium tricinctum TaxID=61284 RepID=A0A8K0S301_9HYPO|nr:hypothetical protein BKA59DRAFT_474245 [Fusarium tricinctum]